ncbi:neuronal acetylcholine receptor subunit beta-3-like [Anthonomus grandis grandis]|uniref:neuronal acetylcholine receptor subunit beta-3-like n=1 Tax=Anthonomus grandis grandis TaxID=2921223 RepID=UPI0021656136|nr:neuronal acetylcholine receptor subunit beta-3-like [Anthonomus grandis grandis]
MFGLLIFFVIFSDFGDCMFYKSNVTDLSKCNVSYSRTGSTYKDFYPIYTKKSGLFLDFHFAVLAQSDAHILLAESENINKSDPAYEIVIGAGGNTFSDIRRMQKSDVRHSVRIKNLLSALDPQFFWLHIVRNGTGGQLEVGREGENKSFIDWYDDQLLPVKYISFSTWNGIEAKWYFNCDRSEDEEEIAKRISPLQKLRRDLLKLYDPMVSPTKNSTDVYMALDLQHLDLDDYKSLVELRGTALMRWIDEKLQWNPRDYNNISVIHMGKNEIWKPEFKSGSVTQILFQDSLLEVTHTGNITWQPSIHVQEPCLNSQIIHWPRDIHRCFVVFTLAPELQNVSLQWMDNGSSLHQHDDSQWVILDAAVYHFDNNDSDELLRAFELFFEIQRSSVIYNIVFFLPFIVIAICLLLSFWIPPNKPMKLSLGGAQLVMEIIMLLSLAHFLPPGSGDVPILVIIYSCCLLGTILSLTMAVVIINLSRQQQVRPLHRVICFIVTSKVIRRVLCLPAISMPEDYGGLGVSLSFANLAPGEERATPSPEQKGDDWNEEVSRNNSAFWIMFLIALDRVMFLICTIIVLFVVIKCITLGI